MESEQDKTRLEIANIIDELIKSSGESNIFQSELRDVRICKLWKRKIQISYNRSCYYLYILPSSSEFGEKEFAEVAQRYKQQCDAVFVIDLFSRIKNKANKISPAEFYKLLFDFSGYLDYIATNQEFQVVKQLFVDRKIRLNVDEERFGVGEADVLKCLSNWADGKTSKSASILLLGDRGYGKSWIAKNFCLRQVEKFGRNPWLKELPIYITLNYLSSSDFPQRFNIFDAILYQIKEKYGIRMLNDYYVWETFIKSGKFILVFDGFDEISKELNEEIMNKNLWEIFSVIQKTPRVLITSRKSHFNSWMKILEHFSYTNFIKAKQESNSDFETAFTEIGTRIRHNFNIWEIKGLEGTDLNLLVKKYELLRNKVFKKAIKRFQIIRSKSKQGSIEYELEDISRIPAVYSTLISVLSRTNISNIELYKLSLLSTIIQHNIDLNRAIRESHTIKGGEIKSWELVPFQKSILVFL